MADIDPKLSEKVPIDAGIESVNGSENKSDPDLIGTVYDVKSTKRLLRKIDLYLIPFLSLLYL